VPADRKLVEAMDEVRSISSVAQSLRKLNGLRVRLPLATLNVVTKNVSALEDFADLIADELNVKTVRLVELSLESTSEFGVVKRLTVNSRAAGPRIGKSVQAVIQSAKSGDWSEKDGEVVAGGVALEIGEYEIDLVADMTDALDGVEKTEFIGILSSGGFVILDGKVTPELAAEGLARDVIRGVQQARKDADFDVSDRIALTVVADASVIEAVHHHAELIKGETLSLELHASIGEVVDGVEVGEGQSIQISVTKL
jgi:isoleucyl-tRNA synthetase